MTTGNAPTIEEQIEFCRDVVEKMQRMSISNPMNDAILASLEKLAAIESQPVPVEPESVTNSVRYHDPYGEVRKYIDSLQSALKLAQSQLPEEMKNCTILFERCDKGHGHLRGDNWIKHDCLVCRAEKAESLNRRMVELLKEPSASMKGLARGLLNLSTVKTEADATMLFKVMSAELLKEIANG